MTWFNLASRHWILLLHPFKVSGGSSIQMTSSRTSSPTSSSLLLLFAHTHPPITICVIPCLTQADALEGWNDHKFLDTQNTVKLVAAIVTWSHTTWFLFVFRRRYCLPEGCQCELKRTRFTALPYFWENNFIFKKITVLWDETPCSLVNIYYHHF